MYNPINMSTKKQNVRAMAIAVLLILTAGLHAMAQGLTIRPTDTGQTLTSGDYTYTDGLLTVKTTTPVTISSNGEKTDHTIAVADEIGGKATITLENVYIENDKQCLFDIRGNASVLLKLMGGNQLVIPDKESGSDYPVLRCEKDGEKTASLEIEGPGELNVIFTESYRVTDNGACIGGSNGHDGGNITITSGVVTAKVKKGNEGDVSGACIGGGKNGGAGKITISGGVVTVRPYKGTGIGEGYSGSGGEVTISGGVVMVTATQNNCIGGTFSTGNDGSGKAFIIAECLSGSKNIADESNKSSWSGIIFEGETYAKASGKVYGNPSLPEGVLTIPSKATLTIDYDKTLTIGSGTTLINEGTIINNGTISNSGVLAVKTGGTLTNNTTVNTPGNLYTLGDGTALDGTEPLSGIPGVVISFDGNVSGETISSLPTIQIIAQKSGNPVNPTVTPLRSNYTCVGWSESSSSRTLITNFNTITSSDDKTLYAVWKYNTKLAFTGDSYSDTYGEQATVTATATGDGNNEPTGTVTYSYYSDAGCANLVSGTPNVGTYYVKATYPGDDNYTRVETPTAVTCTIKEKELTVTPTPNQTIYSDEHPAYTVSGAFGTEKPAFTDHLDVSNGKVTLGSLALANDNTSGFIATNYTLELSSSDVDITQESKTLEKVYNEAISTLEASITSDWYKEAVVLTPSTGFEIAGSSTLKSTSDWKNELTVDGSDGTYEVKYRLKRADRAGDWDNTSTSSDEQTLTVKLDKTVPAVTVTPDKLTLTVALSDATSGLASCTYDWNGAGESETLTPGEKSHSFTLTAPSAGDYSLKVVLIDQAGNETTYSETVTLTEPVTPPVDPVDPIVPPVGPSEPEVTYTITLPALEGAATDPAAGDYKVTDWSDFGFLLTLDAAYNQSAPIVTTDRGETIEPRVSDGKYVIKRVRSNVSVSISGIVKNPDPVANEEVSSPALRIYTDEGVLCLDVSTATEAYLITADGRLLRSLTLSPGLNRVYGLRQGVYIVRLKDGTTRKVLIGK